MPKFRVQWDEVHRHDIDIEADSEVEAREKFWLAIHEADTSLWDDTEAWISEPQAVNVTEWHATYQGRQA